MQTLWESGHIDPSIPISKYKVKGNKTTDVDENGNLKPEATKFILSYLLSNRPDFKNEPTDIENLASELSTVNSTVTAIFTPKYHAEIAGEGVECGWGFSKKIN